MQGGKSWLALAGIVVVVAGCAGGGVDTAASVPLDLPSEIVISNGSLDVAVTDVEAIEMARFTTSEISVSEEYADQVQLYRLTVEFTNVGEGSAFPRHTTLDVDVTERLEDHVMYVTGYCEPAGSDPTGAASMCFKLSSPGSYGVVSVFQETPVEIALGETSQLQYVLMVNNVYEELTIAFPDEPADEDAE